MFDKFIHPEHRIPQDTDIHIDAIAEYVLHPFNSRFEIESVPARNNNYPRDGERLIWYDVHNDPVFRIRFHPSHVVEFPMIYT